MGKLFLGLDSSTQSLSAVLVDHDSKQVIYETSLSFDEQLPHYGTRNGVLEDPDPRVVRAPPLMWAEAIDVIFQQMKDAGVPLGDVLAISGSGQQHGSVYLRVNAPSVLAGLDPSLTLVENLEGVFSRATSPIWMDSSTHAECVEIRDALGGLEATAQATGSTTFERFTGPQIRKFAKTDPEGYEQTAHIQLVSSFMASLLAGKIAPIDHGDGAGMNLMDITAREWHPAALEATAPGLREKLPELTAPWTLLGNISPCFHARYGLNPQARVLAWSGDNPNSVVGLGLIQEGLVAISLGTSDTYFGTMQECRTDPRGEGHVFVSPTGDYMTLICFKNGSLAREAIRQRYDLNWEEFSQALRETPAGNEGKILLPYFEPEIVPNMLDPGVHRIDLSEEDVPGNCRAVVEAQMMSMRIHSRWMGVQPHAIYATGGAAVNPEILQIMADVQQCPVHRFEVTNSAALGAALRAAHGYLLATGTSTDWSDIVSKLAEPVPGSIVQPDRAVASTYESLVAKYAACEQSVLEG